MYSPLLTVIHVHVAAITNAFGTLNEPIQADKVIKILPCVREKGAKLIIHEARYGWADNIWKAALGSGKNHGGGAKDVTQILQGDVIGNEVHINPDQEPQFMNKVSLCISMLQPPSTCKMHTITIISTINARSNSTSGPRHQMVLRSRANWR
jgi:hypothetical protein